MEMFNNLFCFKFILAKSWHELKNIYNKIHPSSLRNYPQLNLLFFQAFVFKSKDTFQSCHSVDHYETIFLTSKLSHISFDQIKRLIPDFDINISRDYVNDYDHNDSRASSQTDTTINTTTKSKNEEDDDDKGKKEKDNNEPEIFFSITNKKRKATEAIATPAATPTTTAAAAITDHYLEEEPIAKRTRRKTRM